MKKYEEIVLDDSNEFSPINGKKLNSNNDTVTQLLRDTIKKGLEIPEDIEINDHVHNYTSLANQIADTKYNMRSLFSSRDITMPDVIFNNMKIVQHFNIPANILYRMMEIALYVVPWNQFYIVKSRVFMVNERVSYDDYYEKINNFKDMITIPITDNNIHAFLIHK